VKNPFGALAMLPDKIKRMKKTVEEVFEEESQAHAEKERVLNEKIDAEIMQYIDNPVLGLQFKRPVITRPSNPSLFFIVSFL
jgi:hypothetical protein